ncbi:MAG: DUF1963 domain-containing protein [Planctomycetes bacterium]|nr:DUF1963 domain-containing protein [Planctomycetota bacterium]
MRDVSALISKLAMPAIQVTSTGAPSSSHLGGDPALPLGFSWPEWKGRKLTFLGRISLKELQAAQDVDWLPQDGALLFFYDTEEQPWGFDPKDRGCCSVLCVPDNAPAHAASDGARSDVEYFPRIHVGFRRIDSVPSTHRDLVLALDLTDEEAETFWRAQDQVHSGLPRHQIGGFPYPVQGDYMELECQLVTNGLYCGDSTGYEDPRATQLQAGAKSWRLLLQLDTDDDADMMWGDCGTLYFWVREDDARQGCFENVWLILQCS